ncbi:MAG: helix-turn-helix transcriptional regulator [Aeromonadaceae bacterium]
MTKTQIKQARQSLGLNQSEMAKAMGVNRVTYTKWERGEQSITAGPSTEIEMMLYMMDSGIIGGWLLKMGVASVVSSKKEA